jgi:predicted dehydrogenase
LCEKPFTLNIDEALMIEVAVTEATKDAASRGVPPPLFLVDHELRALHCVMEARKLVADDSKFGRLLHANMTYSFGGAAGISDTFTW